jgi:hypothetical protein
MHSIGRRNETEAVSIPRSNPGLIRQDWNECTDTKRGPNHEIESDVHESIGPNFQQRDGNMFKCKLSEDRVQVNERLGRSFRSKALYYIWFFLNCVCRRRGRPAKRL